MGELDISKGFFIPFPKEKVIEVVEPSQEFFHHLDGSSRLRIYDSGTIQLYLSTNNIGDGN